MNTALGHAFNSSDMFYNFPWEKTNLTYKDALKYCSDTHKEVILNKIFCEFLNLVIDDCIENNATYKLPVTGRDVTIHINRVDGLKFKLRRQRGGFKKVDFLTSNFCGYDVVLEMRSKKFKKVKKIYTTKEKDDKLTELVNQGKQYC